jgi:hypothetical protein
MAIAYVVQTYSFFQMYPFSWMFFGTLAIACVVVPFFFVFFRFKDKEEVTRFDLIEEEVREETEQEPGQRTAIELEELLMDSGKNVKF